MREMPINFPFMARTMTISGAAKFWGTDNRTVKRWIAEVGDGMYEAMIDNAKRISRAAGAKQGPKNNRPKPEPVKPLNEDEAAMRYLQRAMRWVCYSSRIYGDTKNVRYHVGNRKLSFDELIALAESYGFNRAQCR